MAGHQISKQILFKLFIFRQEVYKNLKALWFIKIKLVIYDVRFHSTYRCGPLIGAWCMRYEAKNKYFKRIASTIGNFKKEKTVASRHQRYMCYKMSCTLNILGGDTKYGVGKLIIL